jgi:hypothetical protein
MDHNPRSLTDADLDREIQTALAVDPSPQFVARVRSEIDNEPIAARIPWRWAIAAACAVVVAIPITNGVRSAVVPLKPRSAEVSTRPAVSKLVEPASAMDVSEPGARISRIPMTSRPAARAKASIVHEPAMPEVILDPENVEAFRQLIVSVRERRFEATFDETSASTPWEMTDLTVAPPIIIEPLEQPAANN